ncbi:MAG: hypothetical protein CMI63_07905 [Parvularcula sp.]|nr:hypothetical protein [Parvularcula sp.]
MKRAFQLVLLYGVVAACASSPEPNGIEPGSKEARSWADALGSQITAPYHAPEHRAFDFWIGEWEANWRPPQEGAFEHQKEGSFTRQRVFPVLGGKAIIELAWARDNPQDPSQRGFSIRYFDPARARWVMAQNWPNENNTGGAFTDQLIGNEHLGRLTMYSAARRPKPDGSFADEHRRYNFTDIRPGVSFRWDGSNSGDKGATWFTWYVVDFLRQRDLDPFGAAGTDFPGVHDKALCTEEPHGAMNALRGEWEGVRVDAGGKESPARLSAGLVLDGCGVLAALETDDRREILAVGYDERFSSWAIFRLDDRPGTTHAYYISEEAGEGAAFAEAPMLAIKDEVSPYREAASFSSASAERRLIFSSLSNDGLVLRDEARQPGSGWTLIAEYRLTRR